MEHQKPNKLNKNVVLACGAVVAVCLMVLFAAYKGEITSYLGKNIKGSQTNNAATAATAGTGNKLYDATVAEVLPADGFQSKVVLGDTVVKLVQSGAIDSAKFSDMYKTRGGFPEGFKDILTAPSSKPILLTKANANFYINLLWPLGLSNYMEWNKQSPINGKDLNNFASTGGWNLGKENNGGAYFNKFKIVPLTSAQENLAVSVAKNIYRPCCGNSTFFQDCNHGSALLGFLELGASQGLTEAELYKEALAFNSFWFPQNYVQLGLYFKVIKNTDWKNVDPKLVLSKDYSSSGGNANIQSEVGKIPDLVPSNASYGGGSCGA